MQASVEVDVTSVEAAIDGIMRSIEPIGLNEFLQELVKPFMQNQMINRFSSNGGGEIGGAWAPLEESTIAIRNALGYYEDDAVNERSGQLLDHMLTSTISETGEGSQMVIPEESSNTELNRKLRTAQSGYVQGPSDMIPGAYTPPRPVLDLGLVDVEQILAMLQVHIVGFTSRSLPGVA